MDKPSLLLIYGYAKLYRGESELLFIYIAPKYSIERFAGRKTLSVGGGSRLDETMDKIDFEDRKKNLQLNRKIGVFRLAEQGMDD